MADIFADTAGWGHLIDKTQLYHSQASRIYRITRQEGRKLITTNYILVELVSLLTTPLRIPRPQVVAFIESIKASPFVEIIHVHEGLDDLGWQMLVSHQDKDWSLTDCISFVVMHQKGLSEALTTDHHFEQAGFVRLLKA